MTQHNRPYRFLASRSDLEALTSELEKIGIESVMRDGNCLLCAAPWLDEPITIVFESEWWPDGQCREDDRIVLKHGGSERSKIDVSLLLRNRHEKRLGGKIIGEIVARCSHITGKADRTNQKS